MTLKCGMRRGSCARTTKTNKISNQIVGTVKKSTETNCETWFVKTVFQVCDGGFRCRTMYLATVACETVTPSF